MPKRHDEHPHLTYIKNSQKPNLTTCKFTFIRDPRDQNREDKTLKFLVTFMDQIMKYTVHEVRNSDKPNIKITIGKFCKLQS